MTKTLLFSCFLSAAGISLAGAADVSSSVRAEIKDAIPGATQKATKPIYYPEPGKINISATQWCGDSDVEHYAQGNPAWRNMLASKMPFVLGYWVTPEEDSLKYVPTPTNFVALGSGIVPVGGQYISEFVPANQEPKASNQNQQMYPYALRAIRNIASAKSFSMKGDGSGKYRLYLGVMMCHDGGAIDDIPVKDQGRYRIAPAEMSSALAGSVYEGILKKADAYKSKSWGKMEDGMAFSLTLKTANDQSSGGVGFEAGGDKVRLNGYLAGLAERVNDFDVGDFIGKPVKDIQEALEKKSFAKPLGQLAASLDSSANCVEVNKQVDEMYDHGANKPKVPWIRAKYGWEPYPLQLTCRALNDGTRGTFSKAVAAFLEPKSSDKKALEDKRAEVLRLLLQGAQVFNAEAYVQKRIDDTDDKDWKLPKQRCFNDEAPMINYMMQSVVISVPRIQAATYSTSHPEPDFAIGGATLYDSLGRPKYKPESTDEHFTVDGFEKMSVNDSHAVFGMGGLREAEQVKEVSLPLEQGNTSSSMSADFLPATMRINLNVRGVGSCLPAYCLNEKPGHAKLKKI
jgi:hypothetical protein